ncbi:MAG: hypothetical protein IT314_08580 [Anaerolineales bacterium]|nr:hypothetical protein [Anaerolineales bacterium]
MALLIGHPYADNARTNVTEMGLVRGRYKKALDVTAKVFPKHHIGIVSPSNCGYGCFLFLLILLQDGRYSGKIVFGGFIRLALNVEVARVCQRISFWQVLLSTTI